MKRLITVLISFCIFLTACTPLVLNEGEPTPNEIAYDTRTTDVIYAGDNIYYEFNTHQVHPIYEENSKYYADLNIGDIVRMNAKLCTETTTSGVAGGTSTITFEEIYDMKIVTEEYYRDNNFGAVMVSTNITLPKESNLRYSAWKYMYNEDRDIYITVIATTWGNGIAFENGKKVGEYDRYITFPYMGYDWLLLVNDDVSIAEIEQGLDSGDYSKFYCLTKCHPAYSYIWGEPKSNLKNLTVDYVYRGNGEFVTLEESATDVQGFRHLSPLNLTEFTDCTDYKISEVFRINADFIHQVLRDQGKIKKERIIDKLYSIENVTSEYGSGDGTDVFQFSPSTLLDEKTYHFFINICWSRPVVYCYNTDTKKYVTIIKIPATSEYVEHYSIFEDGELIGDFNELNVFDNEKTNIRYVVFFNNIVGEECFSLDDLENKLKSGDLSDIYYIGKGDLDVLFPSYNNG